MTDRKLDPNREINLDEEIENADWLKGEWAKKKIAEIKAKNENLSRTGDTTSKESGNTKSTDSVNRKVTRRARL